MTKREVRRASASLRTLELREGGSARERGKSRRSGLVADPGSKMA